MPSVHYTLAEFLEAQPEQVLGRVAQRYAEMGFASLYTRAIDAWTAQVPILQAAVRELSLARADALGWTLLLEYDLPLRDRRPDVVILAGNSVFVIEFKVGADTFDSAALWQVQSYALDLRDFHPGCRDRAIVPILIATEAPDPGASERALVTQLRKASVAVQQANTSSFGACLVRCANVYCSREAAPIEPREWESAVYSPTPSIIEAAQSLFGGHRVEDISHAFSDTLETTSRRIVRAIEDARRESRRTICFVTGIPGSGKTLVGLNAVHSPALLNDNQSCAVFLSGNGPLVKVIREALTREKVRAGVRAAEAKDVASAFISNVHRFLKNFGIEHPDQVPAQNAIIFDEAQRAWSADAVAREHEVHRSEPAMVLDIMERVPGWSTVVALVGGGQEINTGEAGLAEWGRALADRDTKWIVLVSPEASSGGESVAGHQLFPGGRPPNVEVAETPELHLNISVRSHRAEFIGEWVNRTLSDASLVGSPGWTTEDFPVVLTRDLGRAREWLNERKEEHQRSGLLASSGAVRLRAFGLELSGAFRKGVSYPDWFLNPEGDVRSSFQLEVAASEFDCQGLEIDWAGVCWGGDYVVDPDTDQWDCLQFRGSNWVRIRDVMKRQYTLNKYRVLLTRARRGMVIWVPAGNAAAHRAEALDATARRLIQGGVRELI